MAMESRQRVMDTRRVAPMFPEVGVIGLVPDLWVDYWQPRHHVLARLARYFRVIWVDPAPGWREHFGFGGPVNEGNAGAIDPPPGLTLYHPEFFLPRFGHPEWLSGLTFRPRLKKAHRRLLREGCRKIILYVWRPEFYPALTRVPHDLSCYHIDDEYSFSPCEAPISETELRLITESNQVFIHSPGLLKRKGRLNPHTSYVPNGVDFGAYSQDREEPVDLAAIPRPRIGYTGWLKNQLDWELLNRLAARHGDWSFVFVGARRASHIDAEARMDELSKFGNVWFLGGKSTNELPFYPAHFDVCIMPYRMNHYTECIYPMKLHEYLASGRPTVGARIRSLMEFEGVVSLAAGVDQWSAAIGDALRPQANGAERAAMRRAVARRHDWDVLVGEIARTMAHRLDGDLANQFERKVAALEK